MGGRRVWFGRRRAGRAIGEAGVTRRPSRAGSGRTGRIGTRTSRRLHCGVEAVPRPRELPAIRQTRTKAILHGAVRLTMSLAGNVAMQNTKMQHLPAMRQGRDLAMQSSGKKATRQGGTAALRQFFMAASAWLCYVLAIRQCELPQDGSCQQCGIRQGGLCTPSPYSARKAAPGNPP